MSTPRLYKKPTSHLRLGLVVATLGIVAIALYVAAGHAIVHPAPIPHSHPHVDQPCGNPPRFDAPWQRIRYHSGFHDGHSHDGYGHGYHGNVQDHIHVGNEAVAPDRDYRGGFINFLPQADLAHCSPYGASIPITNPYAQFYAEAIPYGGYSYSYADVYQPYRPYAPYAYGVE